VTGFVVGAGLLATLALGFVLLPLWRHRRVAGRWSGSGLLVGSMLVPIAVLLYLQVTTFRSEEAPAPNAAELAMVRQLADRMVENPDDVEGWNLLGRSYMVLGEYRLARTAYLEAWNRTEAPDNVLKLGLGEALIYTDPGSVHAQAGDLVEEVVTAEPMNQRALWWGGVVAMERGRNEVARERWTRLLGLNPPVEIADVLQRQLALLPGGQPGSTVSGPTASGPTLTADVRVGAEVSLDGLGPNAYVFLFARAPGGGPPIAGRRLAVGELPGTFTLSDADAIIAGRSLAAFPELTLVARISVSGDPIEQPGDLFAEAIVDPATTMNVGLVIDRSVGQN
jgi:cytochrome c-type biogenesis protein CcmH